MTSHYVKAVKKLIECKEIMQNDPHRARATLIELKDEVGDRRVEICITDANFLLSNSDFNAGRKKINQAIGMLNELASNEEYAERIKEEFLLMKPRVSNISSKEMKEEERLPNPDHLRRKEGKG